MRTDPDRKRAVAGLYDRVAATYGTLGPPLFAHAGRRLAELAQVTAGDRVLDVAAGRGAALFAAVARIGRTGHVSGIDLSERMVQETTREIQRLGLLNGAMCQMDAEHLAFADTSFDAVLCSFAIFLFPDVARALAECFRVLRPGGRLGLARSGQPDPRWAWYDQLLAQQEVLLSLGTDAVRQPPELEAALRQAGFGQVRVLSEEVEGVFADEDAWWASLWTHGARTPLERMAPEALERFRVAVSAEARKMRQPDGLHQVWQVIFALALKPPASESSEW